jgi:hypothetical protein
MRHSSDAQRHPAPGSGIDDRAATTTDAPGRRRGVVRTSVWVIVHAPPARVMATFLDYARWPAVFPLTIAGTELVRRSPSTLEVMVQHRKEGRMLNVLTTRGPEVVELREYKRRFDATFVNRFEPAPEGTRYTIDATVRLALPYALLAPLLCGVVERSLRRFTLEPMRVAAERR